MVTAQDFVEMCERAKMRQHTFTLDSPNRFDSLIPCSELAMHVGVCDKTPQLIFLSNDKRYAFVLTTDGKFVDGLTSEVVPWSARPDRQTLPAEYTCSGCGRAIPCRHCPADTPTVAAGARGSINA